MSRDVTEAIAETQRVIDRIREQDRGREAAEAQRVAALRARPPQPRQPRYTPTVADMARLDVALGMIARLEAGWLRQVQVRQQGGRT